MLSTQHACCAKVLGCVRLETCRKNSKLHSETGLTTCACDVNFSLNRFHIFSNDFFLTIPSTSYRYQLLPRQQVIFPENRTKMMRQRIVTALPRILLDNPILIQTLSAAVFVFLFRHCVSMPAHVSLNMDKNNIHFINVLPQTLHYIVTHTPVNIFRRLQ